MLINYTEDSIHQYNVSTNLSYEMACMTTRHGSIVYTSFFIINSILLLPSCILILNQELQRWWRWSTTSSSPAAQKPMDVFNSYYAFIELWTIVSQLTCCCGIYTNGVVLRVGYYFWSFFWFAEITFHALACLERYMAVAHPVLFLRLRRKKGIRIRNLILNCVWLLCAGATAVIPREDVFPHFSLSFILLIFVILACFTANVLCTLIHPVPGQHGGGKWGKVDQSKQMAIYTMLAILGSELLKILGNLLWAVLNSSTHPWRCLVIMSSLWLCIPSAQVIPFLILQKAGTITCCKQSTR